MFKQQGCENVLYRFLNIILLSRIDFRAIMQKFL